MEIAVLNIYDSNAKKGFISILFIDTYAYSATTHVLCCDGECFINQSFLTFNVKG